MFFFNKRKPFLSKPENERVVQAIREAEKRTSGEIRVFIESKIHWSTPWKERPWFSINWRWKEPCIAMPF